MDKKQAFGPHVPFSVEEGELVNACFQLVGVEINFRPFVVQSQRVKIDDAAVVHPCQPHQHALQSPTGRHPCGHHLRTACVHIHHTPLVFGLGQGETVMASGDVEFQQCRLGAGHIVKHPSSFVSCGHSGQLLALSSRQPSLGMCDDRVFTKHLKGHACGQTFDQMAAFGIKPHLWFCLRVQIDQAA